MSRSTLPGIAENFPNAMNVTHKFHVKQVVICVLDAVRKEGRRLFMIPKGRMTAFDSLYSWMRCCRWQPMKDAASTLRKHKEKILAYFFNRIINAVCEGIHSMVQAAQRKARGFNAFEGFASMIYLVADKLQLAVPRPF